MSVLPGRTVAVLVGTLLFTLSACSSTNSGGTGPGQAGLVTVAPTGATPSGSAPASASPAGTTSPIIQTVSGDTWLFVTPSENIGCAVSATSVRCDIGERTWSPPPRPNTCSLDYGNGMVVDAIGARPSCAGDTLLHATTNVLPYGHGVRDANVLCVSQPAGVRCEYVPTGHGFTLAREGYTQF